MSKSKLKEQQKKLNKLIFKKYSLEEEWFSHNLINVLRKNVINNLPTHFLYDPQDLEHQVLFRLTTFKPEDITDEVIKEIIEEQSIILKNRLDGLGKKIDIEYLFRGLSGKYKDLNTNSRLTIKKNNGNYIACNNNYYFDVEFKKIQDKEIIDIFTQDLHYIHSSRTKGDVFGLFFKGDKYPWAIETCESSITSKQYKRDALLAHGIDPTKAIELTRLYILPGGPENAISVLDSLIAKYYSKIGIEALFTTTMPMYSKTRSATIAGGMNNILLIKELKHYFIKRKINSHYVYCHTIKNTDNTDQDTISTHPLFPTLYTVETYMPINDISLNPLPMLRDKVIYIDRKMYQIEKEIKFIIKDLFKILQKINTFAVYKKTIFIRDIFYGLKEKREKIRLRIINENNYSMVEVSEKKRIKNDKNNIVYEEEKTIFSGKDLNSAEKRIKKINKKYRIENSYEKIRLTYEHNSAEIDIDIYPFGVVLEIEGDNKSILEIADKLELKKEDAVTKNADDIYLSWNESKGLKELWHVRFGLSDEFENENK